MATIARPTLIIDSREKPKAVKNIITYFDRKGIDHISSKLYVGDYQFMNNPYKAVDRKGDMQEIVGNLIQDHERLARECDRAYEHGIEMMILIENTNDIHSIAEIPRKWKNPRYAKWMKKPVGKSPTSSETLMKIMNTFSEHHHCKFYFCSPKSCGRSIIYLLTGKDLRA